jgi:hypothetical protein
MIKRDETILILSIFFAILITLESCKKDKGEPIKGKELTDVELFNMSTTAVGFTWYGNSDSLLVKSSGSGHSQPFLRTRYNAVAASKLDSSGKIMSGATFPEGSLIVKELYNDRTTIGRYAVLYKQSGSAVADANGWVWGYINSDGSVAHSISLKGAGCISCHSQSGSIDYMLMEKFF